MNYSMASRDTILLDANILIAINHLRDIHYSKTIQQLEILKEKRASFVTNNHVVDEAISVLTRRTRMLSRSVDLGEMIFGVSLPWFRVYRTPLSWEKEAFGLFRDQTITQKPSFTFLSFTDCILIIQAKRQPLTALWTLDKTLASRCRDEHISTISNP